MTVLMCASLTDENGRLQIIVTKRIYGSANFAYAGLVGNLCK